MIDFADPRGRELALLIERAKYERFVMGEVDTLLDREFDRLVDLLLSAKYRTLTIAQRQRSLQLFREVSARLGAGYRDVTSLVLREMKGYAVLEADVARLHVTSTLTAGGGSLSVSLGPSLPRAYLASIAKLPIQGLAIGEWFEAQAQTMSREARRIIQQGMVEGKGLAEITRRIVADARTPGPVLSRRAKQDAHLVTRTVANAVQNDAAMASYERLPVSVSDSYRLLIVRDKRTSPVCLGLAVANMIVYRYDDPKRKVPPLHIACRTGVQAILKGADVSVAEQKGPVTMGDYAAWLAAQPATVQNDLLGATRADLWRSGRMQLADAIDADGRLLSLTALRAKLGTDAVAAA